MYDSSLSAILAMGLMSLLEHTSLEDLPLVSFTTLSLGILDLVPSSLGLNSFSGAE